MSNEAVAISSSSSKYTVTFARLNDNLPVISSQNAMSSEFKWNYNTAVVPEANDDGFGLLVRAQNQLSPSDPYSTTPSVMPLTKARRPIPWSNLSQLTFDPISVSSSVVFRPQNAAENFGVEDPRIVYRAKTGDYILLYTAAQSYPNGTVIARLAMAMTKTPTVESSWRRLGPLFPQQHWSKSGALLLRDDASPSLPHFLLFGDSTDVPGLQIAVSKNLLNWTILPGIFLPMRPDGFDSGLVEAGPMPLRLSDGNYFFIYNSARHNYSSPKPGYDFQYNVGYAVLDGRNPSQVIQRCHKSTPLITPALGWERGVSPWLGLTPNVVFLEGWIAIPGSRNQFLVFYGGADSVIGAGIISVEISQ
jgi:predicted GH43/DUF377 family glycosyl hydrolase